MVSEVFGLSKVSGISYGDWEAVIDAHGAQVLALFYKGENVLHYDPEDISHSGIPLCLPQFGPLDNGLFSHDGKTYEMRQHGFIRDRDLKLIYIAQNYITYEFVADEVSKQKFPFDFKLQVTFTLSDKGLKISLKVENLSSVAMPLAPGVHPYFKVKDSSDVMLTTKASTANNFLHNYDEESLEEHGIFEIVQDGDIKLLKIHKEPNMNLINHGLEKTTVYRKDLPTIELHSDPVIFNRMTIWRSSENAEFICVEPAYVKNGLNDCPIIIPVDETFKTEVSINITL